MRHLDRLRCFMFKSRDGTPAEQERHASEDPDAAVDKTPCKWYTADVAGNERQRKNSGAANQAKTDYPLIANRIYVRTNERDGNHQVSKC